MNDKDAKKWQMLEMGNGVTTSNGFWYHINLKQINEYIPGLEKKISIYSIIKIADAWVLSADGISLVLYFVLVYFSVHSITAFCISVFFYALFYFNTSSMVGVTLSKIVPIFGHDGFLYSTSAICLMGIGMNHLFSSIFIFTPDAYALWLGIFLVFGFKVGLVRVLINFLSSRIFKTRIHRQDRILNMLLIRYGMHHGILTKRVNQMQDELISITSYHKTRKK